jgi:oxygen-dependent protoporphyrinogen oxidase
MSMRVVIVGAGVAGLTAAYRLGQHSGVEVTLLERDAAPGGRVRTRTLPDGFYADDSAQFVCANYRWALQLMRELGVDEELEELRPQDFAAIYRDGRILPLPATATGLLRTATIAPAEKLALVRLAILCALGYRRGAYVEPSRLLRYDHVRLSEFVTRKFGARVLDEIVDPLVSMTMCPAEDLSLGYLISTASLMLTKHYAFRRGNGTFTQRLASACSAVKLASAARRIVIENDRVRGVELEADSSPIEADAVICATAAHQAAGLLEGDLADEARFLEKVPYGTCVQALFTTDAPYLPCWGLAIPRSCGSFLTYVTEETFKSRARAPDGAGLTQVFAIGEPAKELLRLEDREIADRIWAEVRRLLPDYPERRFSQVIRREEAMVAQAPGYQRELRDFNAGISRIRSLYLVSDYQTNPLIEGSVCLAERVVRKILDEL